MTSEVGMHLHFTVCPPRDDFAPGNASPFNEISSKGCIDDKNRNKINREESSLEENFYPQRSNQLGRIISGKEFLSAGMKLTGKNNLRKRIFVGRDEISWEESSLEEDFFPQG